jgi:phosphotransferase system HPr (HPr) family protein
MTTFKHTISNKNGIDTAKAAEMCKEAKIYTADVLVELKDKKANAKNFHSLKELNAQCGDVITVTISGEDERIAERFLKKLSYEML